MPDVDISELVRRYGPMVFRRARYLLGNDAEAQDAVQEVFVRLVNKIDSFRAESQPSTWLYRITTNYCLNLIRDRGRRRELLEQHATSTEDDPDPGAPDPELMALMRRLLAAADPLQAQAAIYVHVDGMSHAEAAALLNVSRRTVGNLLERFEKWARRNLEGLVPNNAAGGSNYTK
ncbi:MAG: RNA polymerase sigma factor [Candidatus Schekmanbacteria bacterium]|nr:RNA polymerase sigma factor [Candidatus Schekmanbacteria bacterium]